MLVRRSGASLGQGAQRGRLNTWRALFWSPSASCLVTCTEEFEWRVVELVGFAQGFKIAAGFHFRPITGYKLLLRAIFLSFSFARSNSCRYFRCENSFNA